MKNRICNCEPFQVCKLCAEIEPSETSIETDILTFLNCVPWCLATKTGTKGRKVGNIYIKAKKTEGGGKGDITVCLNSKYGEIEVKKPGEKQSPDQIKREIKVRRAGGFYWLVESVDDVRREVENFNKKA
jgi:hypothetical protein